MPDAPSRIFFPLRSNAAGLLSGAQGVAFLRRLKAAALLHDQVILEAGAWHGTAGPEGSTEFRSPAANTPEGLKWQTPRERASAQAVPFRFSLAPSDSREFVPIVTSETTIAWRATFEMIRRQLPRGTDWVEFVEGDLLPDDKTLVKTVSESDMRNEVIGQCFSDRFTKQLAVKNVNWDFLFGTRLQAAVSMDRTHSRLVTARIRSGDAQPIWGNRALRLIVPDPAALSWREIQESRNLKGLRELRRILSEVEEAAWGAAGNFDREITNAFHQRMADAIAKLQPTTAKVAALVALGLALDVVTGLIPAGSVAVSVAAAGHRLHSHFKSQRSWMYAALLLQRQKASRSPGQDDQ